MLKNYNLFLAGKVRPVAVSRNDAQIGPRIGGYAPSGISPSKTYPSTRYLATVALDESGDQEISLFTNLEYDEESNERNLYKNVSKVFSLEDFVQIIPHLRSKRCDSKVLASELPGRALTIGPESPDIVVEPGGDLLLPNKIGGRPYYYYGTRSYIDALDGLFSQGFFLYLQLTWGGYERTVPFLWPFDKFTFHLLAKETKDGIIWRYGWG